jgi:uncharacterized protein (TIGR01777 family)
VLVSLSPFRVPWWQQAFVSWAGLRGAVPIVLATFPVVQGVPDAHRVLNIVFVLVVLFTLVQGPSLYPLARLLRISPRETTKQILVESAPLDVLDAELLTMTVPVGSELNGVSVIELRLPDPSVITLVIRAGRTFVPSPDDRLRVGDELLIVTTRTTREVTERRLRAVSRRGPLAHWFDEYGLADWLISTPGRITRMGITYSSVVDHPIAEVFAWHERRGAVHRLMPPWQPIRVLQEAQDLEQGEARLRLPGGVRWVAQHDGYRRPYRFDDTLSNLPLSWKHHHEFTELSRGRTRVTDRVDTPVPGRVLRQTFRYRHRQLADDLAVRQAMRPLASRQLTVAVTGSSGLIGVALTSLLTTCGHQVIRLVRRAPADKTERQWDPENPAPDLLKGVDALVHLAGESIAGRFDDEHKAAVYDSRVGPTRRLAELVAASRSPITFVCASAVGYYGVDRGEAVLAETAEPGDGFLADVVRAWEAACAPAAEAGQRVVQMRTGIVQSPRGGSLKMLRPLFTAGLGGRLGSGVQWTPWIDLDDLCDAYLRAILDTRVSGPVNAVSPNPVRNAEYTATLGRVLRRPTLVPVPAFGPKLLLGDEGAHEITDANQRVVPDVLTALGHAWRRPALEECLRHQLGRLRD